MKRIFYSVALLAATMIGFTSCEEEEEAKTDLRDKLVGEYSAELTYMVSEDGKDFYNMLKEDIVELGLTTEINTITITKNGDDALAINIGNDTFKTTEIVEENSATFYFNLNGTCTFEGGSFSGKSYVKGYHAVVLSAVGTMIDMSIVGKTSDFPKMENVQIPIVRIDFELDKK